MSLRGYATLRYSSNSSDASGRLRATNPQEVAWQYETTVEEAHKDRLSTQSIEATDRGGDTQPEAIQVVVSGPSVGIPPRLASSTAPIQTLFADEHADRSANDSMSAGKDNGRYSPLEFSLSAPSRVFPDGIGSYENIERITRDCSAMRQSRICSESEISCDDHEECLPIRV